MNTDSKNPSSSQSDVLPTSRLFDDWIDPIESGVRARVRDWIEALVHSELDAALQRPRYGRSTGGETEPAVAPVRGYRNGSRTRTLTGTFGKTDITVPRARLQGADGAARNGVTHGSRHLLDLECLHQAQDLDELSLALFAHAALSRRRNVANSSGSRQLASGAAWS